MIALLLCWLLGHKFENPINQGMVREEGWEETDYPAPYHVLAFCDRCGVGPWRIS